MSRGPDTDWSLYGTCPACGATTGNPCRKSLQLEIRIYKQPHAKRPKLKETRT